MGVTKIELETLDPDKSFKVKMEAYLYIDAGKIMEFGKGDPEKLREYMDKRIKIIEEITKVKRPFQVVEGGRTLLKVK